MMAGRISPLANPAFRTLFAAQICSLVAIGLMTVGMSLAAYRIGGAALAGQILGFLLAVKMVAYVGIAPLAEAVFAGRSRKRVMVGLDLARSAMLLPMAFAVTTWQVAGLALLFFAVSASFTPLFQSVIPDLLTDEDTYGRALVWSRMASTLESVLSPVLAAIALLFVTGEYLFWLAALAFAGSVLALMRTRFPQYTRPGVSAPFKDRALRGLTIYRRTPRLRALFTVNLALAFSMAWVLVNSVVVASVRLGDAELFLPVLMAVYGVGAVLGALAVPQLLARQSQRTVMLAGGLLHVAAGLCILLPLGTWGYFPLWAVFGAAASLVLTPGGLMIARSASGADRPALFAAQFSLSHAGWLVAYPLAGFLAAQIGLEPALIFLSLMTLGFVALAAHIWPATDPLFREHDHPDLPHDHPHVLETPAQGPRHQHAHAFHIDDLHPEWAGSRPA